MINLKTKEKDKFKDDGEWFKEVMKYTKPHASVSSADYLKLLSLYKIVNLDLSDFKRKVELFCNPLGDILDVESDEFTATPELKTKIQVLVGEIIKRNDQFKLRLLSSRAIKHKNEQLKSLIAKSIDEKVALEINSLQQQMQGMPEEEALKMIQDLRSQKEPEDLNFKNWLSDLEIFYNTILRNAYQEEQIQRLQSETIQDAAITDRFFVYNGWKFGKPTIEVRNVLFTDFLKDPDQPFVHKGAWVSYRRPVLIQDAITEYNLTDEQIESLTITQGMSKYHDGPNAKPVYDNSLVPIYEAVGNVNSINDPYVGLNQTSSSTYRRRTIWETHFEFIAFKEVVFISYKDEYDKDITEVQSSEFEIPNNAVKEEFYNRYDQKSTRYRWFDDILQKEFVAEELWIPRKYEIIRLGNDIYPLYREVPYQEVNIENPFDVSLSTKVLF